jgi:hypothetical protein
VSEYQYYEFVAVDHPLTQRQQGELRALSTRARITSFDTLFLAAPVSFDGLLIQCAGRVIRAAPGKDVAEVHDYHDGATPVLASSLKRRMPGYRALGFTRA